MARGQSIEAYARELEAVFGSGREGSQDAPGCALGLAEFIPHVSPGYSALPHLGPLIRLFERAASGEQVKAVVSMPPRHGKTELFLHAIAWFLARNPATQIAYLSASAKFALEGSSRAKDLAREAGVSLSKSTASKGNWKTGVAKGGVWSCGIGGQINGKGFNLILVDDPHVSRAAAESQVIRDHVHTWLTNDAFTRKEPSGTSILVCHTRWHPDDLIGRLTNRQALKAWEVISLPAIDEQGQALWPEAFPLSFFAEQRDELGDYAFDSLYQQQPQADGSTLFRGTHFYEELPDLALARICIGVDFAYSSKSSADYSTAVVLAEINGVFYVLDVIRFQGDIREFRSRVACLVEAYPGSFVTAYANIIETGSVEFFRDGGLNVGLKRALQNKLTNALSVSAAWNIGKILLPHPDKFPNRETPWRDKFVSEVCGFTGKGDRNDDQVDGLAVAHDSLKKMTVDWDHIDALNAAAPRAITF